MRESFRQLCDVPDFWKMKASYKEQEESIRRANKTIRDNVDENEKQLRRYKKNTVVAKRNRRTNPKGRRTEP